MAEVSLAAEIAPEEEMPLVSGQCYESSQRSTALVSGFEKLWQNQLMFDTKLIVQGQVFEVHRSFLAALSEFFRLMFTGSFAESKTDEVKLAGVSARGVHAMLEFAYNGILTITNENVTDIIEAAAYLQFTEALHFCSQYFDDEISVGTCMKFLKLAETYDLVEKKQDIEAFVRENFIAVAKNTDFWDLSLDKFCDFLADDRLKAVSELAIFEIAFQWLQKHSDKEDITTRVLGLVRYGLMGPKDMEVVKTSTDQLNLNTASKDIITSALCYHMRLFEQPIIDVDTNTAQIRSSHESILVIGGSKASEHRSNKPGLNTMVAAVLTEGENPRCFKSLCPANIERRNTAVAVVNGFVYVAGGLKLGEDNKFAATDSAHRYNPRDNTWLQIASMKNRRGSLNLVFLQNSLFATGGSNTFAGALNTSERYDFASNEWSMIANLPHPLQNHAGCVHDNQIFLSGGIDCKKSTESTDEVHSYDPRYDGWQLRSPMHYKRTNHVMVCHGAILVACLGVSGFKTADKHDILATESYDVTVDQWTIMSNSLVGQSIAPVIQNGNKIFILGGLSLSRRACQSSIQCYNLDSDHWEIIDLHLPHPMMDVTACRVKLPL